MLVLYFDHRLGFRCLGLNFGLLGLWAFDTQYWAHSSPCIFSYSLYSLDHCILVIRLGFKEV